MRLIFKKAGGMAGEKLFIWLVIAQPEESPVKNDVHQE